MKEKLIKHSNIIMMHRQSFGMLYSWVCNLEELLRKMVVLVEETRTTIGGSSTYKAFLGEGLFKLEEVNSKTVVIFTIQCLRASGYLALDLISFYH